MALMTSKFRSAVLIASMIIALLGGAAPGVFASAVQVPRSMEQLPIMPGAYEDGLMAEELLASYEPEHNVIGTLRGEHTKVLFVDQVVDDVAWWYEKALGYPSVTLEELSVSEGIGPGGESPMYYWYEYYIFPDSDGYDQYGQLVWPGVFITKSLAESRRTWMRGSILQVANYGWYFKDMENSITDCMIVLMDAGFDFGKMIYEKRTAIIFSWEVYEPFTEADLATEEDPELTAYIKDVEEFAEMLLADPPTAEMLDVPIHKDMLFDPFTTAMYMMEGDPMYTFFWDVEPEEAMKQYSEILMLKPEDYEGGWVFVFSGRLPYPMHALYIYPNEIEGVPFKTLIFVRKEVVTR